MDQISQEERRKNLEWLLLTPLAESESTRLQSVLITGSNIYSHLTLDLPSGWRGKSADYPGSAWELWIRKVLIPVKMQSPPGMRLREKALPGRNHIDQQGWTGSHAKPYLSLGPQSWLCKQWKHRQKLLFTETYWARMARKRVKEGGRRLVQAAHALARHTEASGLELTHLREESAGAM